MYLQILKKDIKRKKTMNVILLLFITLATMFVASSVNNIMTVTNALDYFFEEAEVPDYFVATKGNVNDNSIEEAISNISDIESCKTERIIYATPSNFYRKDVEIEISTKNTSVISAFEDSAIKFFDMDNNIIKGVKKGTILISGKTLKDCGIKDGEEIEIRFDGITVPLIVKGSFKDAVLGSDMMGMTRFLINEKDFEKLIKDETISSLYGGTFCNINTDNISEIEKVFANEDNIIFNGDMNMLKMTYVMNMIIAGVLLIVSICLIFIAFVVLRFTITFTLNEEFREIGVMKAIGVKNKKIRTLCLTKYLLISVVGALVGFFASIPFAEMLIKSVSEAMVLKNEHSILVNFICCILIVAVIMMFSFSCTGKVKNFKPLDAIRNGTTGERFNRKSILRLGKIPAKPSFFMALNDVLSSPKRFLSIILTYTLSLTLVLVMVNTVNTLRSDDLVTAFGVAKTDVYLSKGESELVSMMTSDGKEKLAEKMDELEKTLAENNMPGKCTMEAMYKLNISHGDKVFKSITFQGIRTTTDSYEYFKGTPPQNENEIAITKLVSEKIDAGIGDKVTISHSFGEKEYIITALYHSMNNMGEGIRLHESAETDFSQVSGMFAYQIEFDDNPDKNTIESRVEKLKDIYDIEAVYEAGEFVEHIVGVTDAIDSVNALTLGVVIVIIILVTVLMERSFIAKEQGEIAILKAIGFKTDSIISWHVMRFTVVGVISAILSLIILMPVTKLSITPIFKMMGAS